MLNCGAVDRILWMLWRVVSSDVVRSTHHVTRHYTSIHNILSTAPQLSISQKAIGTLPEDGNVLNGCIKNQQIHQLFIQFINYVWWLLHVLALHCHLQGAFLVPSERCSIEEHSIEYCGWRVVSIDVVRTAHHVNRHNTPIY